MYDAYDWVFEAERDLEGIENEVPVLSDDAALPPFGMQAEGRRRVRPARRSLADRPAVRERSGKAE